MARGSGEGIRGFSEVGSVCIARQASVLEGGVFGSSRTFTGNTARLSHLRRSSRGRDRKPRTRQGKHGWPPHGWGAGPTLWTLLTLPDTPADSRNSLHSMKGSWTSPQANV